MKGRAGRALLIILPVLLLAGGGGGFFLLRVKGSHKGKKPAVVTQQLELKDMVVNLADADHPRYITISLTLSIEGAESQDALAEKEAAIRDAVLMVISSHRYRDLLSPEGKDALKEELAKAVDGALDKGMTVSEVLFTNFVME